MAIEPAWPWLTFAALGMFHGYKRRWDGFSPWRSGCIGKAADHGTGAASHGGRPCALHLGRGGIRYAYGDDGRLHLHPSSSLGSIANQAASWREAAQMVRVGMTAGVLRTSLKRRGMATASRYGLMLVRAWTHLLKHADHWQRFTADFARCRGRAHPCDAGGNLADLIEHVPSVGWGSRKRGGAGLISICCGRAP